LQLRGLETPIEALGLLLGIGLLVERTRYYGIIIVKEADGRVEPSRLSRAPDVHPLSKWSRLAASLSGLVMVGRGL
jgi:hypothetical protein